jgi:cysteinyl-tRNA synthetase
MPLRIYNTLTRAKDVFEPEDPNFVRMYVCGPTVYDNAHIGNARPIIVFDVLFRLLRYIYGADHVNYVRNITDVDDKINDRAREQGISIGELTQATTARFHEDIDALGVLEPTVEPRATDHIGDMINLIELLLERGFAYVAQDHVLFHVPSMPEYGRLSRRSAKSLQAGARVEVAPYKQDPMDFVLWKPSGDRDPGWSSPWGTGRPGWHIECSAMSWRHLGKTIDIHGGGIDLTFPHHENELAQSRCCFGTEYMAKYWMHNGFLQVEGRKMAKSEGNFITINELLAHWPGQALRLNLLRSHYRQPIDWTSRGLDESDGILKRWRELIGQFGNTKADDPQDRESAPDAVMDALCDDLNTPRALTAIHELASRVRLGDADSVDPLKRSLALMGLLPDPGARERAINGEALDQETEQQVLRLIERRSRARADKDFATADLIRQELDEMNIVIKDGPEGSTWEIKR